MKAKVVQSAWIYEGKLRLDAKPFLSGAFEARVLLTKAKLRRQPLSEVTERIFHAGRESRNWVENPDYGVPFLGSTAILNADLTGLPLISKRQVQRNPGFVIRPGWTLITRSGTIGRMAYVRPEMDGMACSEHAMRVVPDEAKIPPGYLYAFLSSKYGVPMVTSGTYGAIIQHIEPEHIADLPIPRLAPEKEAEVHQLIQEATKHRVDASSCRSDAIQEMTETLCWSNEPLVSVANVAMSTNLARRMDAFHHSIPIRKARDCLQHSFNARPVADMVESVFEPNRGARLKVDDPGYGIPFLSSSEVFRMDPKGDYLISRAKTPHLASLLVSERDLLIPRSGQLGGIIGRAVLPLPTFYGDAASEHLVRFRCRSREDACYLWAVFASQPGYYSAIGTAFGSSIPSLDCGLLEALWVPWFEDTERRALAVEVQKSVDLQASAIELEHRAISIVEKAIEAAA